MNPIAAGLTGLAMILACVAALVRGRVIHGVSRPQNTTISEALTYRPQFSTAILALATLLSWGTWGLNLAIVLIVRNGVFRAGGSVAGVSRSSTSFRFQWGGVMPLSLIAAVSNSSDNIYRIG